MFKSVLIFFSPPGSRLIHAAENGNLDVVKDLLTEHGGDISPVDKGLAIRGAAKGKHRNIVKHFLTQCPDILREFPEISADDKCLTDNGVHVSGMPHNSIILSLLITDPQVQAKITAFDNWALVSPRCKGLALQYAAEQDHWDIAKSLLEKCATEISPKFKRTVFFKSVQNNRLDVLKSLLENKKSCTDIIARDKGRMLQYYAVCNGYVDIVKYLITKCDAEFSEEDKNGALWFAVDKGHLDIVKFVLERWGSKIGAEEKYTSTLRAIDKNHHTIIDILLTDLDVQGKITDHDNQALRLAVQQLRVEIVLKLLEYFAVVKYEADKNWRELLKLPYKHSDVIQVNPISEAEVQSRPEYERKISEAFDMAKENLAVQINILDVLYAMIRKPVNTLMQALSTLNQHPGMRALGLEIRPEEDWQIFEDKFEDKLVEWGNRSFQKQNPELSYCIGYFLNQRGKEVSAIEHFSLLNPMSPFYKYAMFECANIYYFKDNFLKAFQYALLSQDSGFSEMIALSYIKSFVMKSDLTWNSYNSFSSVIDETSPFYFVTKLNLSNFSLEDCVTLLKFNTNQIVNQWKPISDLTQLKEKLSEIKNVAEIKASFASKAILSFMRKANLQKCESEMAIPMDETPVMTQKR